MQRRGSIEGRGGEGRGEEERRGEEEERRGGKGEAKRGSTHFPFHFPALLSP